jgi:hypothetical protein
MNYTKIDEINYQQLVDCYYHIENKIVWNIDSGKSRQTSIQYADQEDVFLSATSSLLPNRLEKEYHLLNPLFVNTPFEDIVKKYNLVRSRLMWMDSKSCYSIHRDFSKRLHIPLVTNEDCRFIFPDDSEIFHLPIGGVYSVNTHKRHSFCNFSKTSRLHFLGCVY